MEFIYNGKKCIGDKISVLCDILEIQAIELNPEETDRLVNMLLMDEIPQRYYDDGLLNFDKLNKDIDTIIDMVRDNYL